MIRKLFKRLEIMDKSSPEYNYCAIKSSDKGFINKLGYVIYKYYHRVFMPMLICLFLLFSLLYYMLPNLSLVGVILFMLFSLFVLVLSILALLGYSRALPSDLLDIIS